MAVMYVKPASQIVPFASFVIYVCSAIKPPKAGIIVTIGRPYFEMTPVYLLILWSACLQAAWSSLPPKNGLRISVCVAARVPALS